MEEEEKREEEKREEEEIFEDRNRVDRSLRNGVLVREVTDGTRRANDSSVISMDEISQIKIWSL